MEETKQDNSTTFILDENGNINWKAMIPAKFLYVNNDIKKRQQIEKKYGKSYEELDPIKDNIADSDLICMLGGLKHLLKLRKYKSVRSSIKESGRDYASVNCSIVFKGRQDIKGEEEDVEYSDNACAHTDNTTNFAKHYLLEMATNRALARCIRSFLNINVVSKEELSENSNLVEEAPQNDDIPTKKLEEVMKNNNITFDMLRERMVKDSIKGAADFKSVKDVPGEIKFVYIDKIKKKFENKQAKQ